MASEGRVLVVVESPAKCRTIQKYLGPSYVVQASLGHVRDLPAKGKRGGRWEELPGLDPKNGWEARWEVLDGKRDTVARLKKLAGRTRVVVLATDQDREGEAIAWHLCELLGGKRERFRRVTFNEITRSAIERAFARPRRIDGRLVDAQNARRFLDRVVGYRVSPLLGRRLGAGLSAGRVQSPALRLVVEREREIQAFKPTEYWEVVVAARSSDGDLIEFEVVDGDTETAAARASGDRALRFLEEAAASRVVERVREAGRVAVRSVRSAEEVRKPPAPFTTSTLQQAASARLKLGVAETMEVAQRLYEAGRITYMRTDSTALSAEAVEALRGEIAAKWGDEALPPGPVAHASAAQAQEAHEAIRPADVTRCVAGESDVAERVYGLVRRRALASQMSDVVLRRTRVGAESAGVGLRARGTVVARSGWYAAWPPDEEEERLLPLIGEGDEMAVEAVRSVRKRTKAPKHFTEASLVRELEKRGIGRPSTYAATLKTLALREYVVARRRDLLATEKGCSVVDWLGRAFPELLDYGFTARLEEQLDRIAAGGADWKRLLDVFDSELRKRLSAAPGVAAEGVRA